MHLGGGGRDHLTISNNNPSPPAPLPTLSLAAFFYFTKCHTSSGPRGKGRGEGGRINLSPAPHTPLVNDNNYIFTRIIPIENAEPGVC